MAALRVTREHGLSGAAGLGILHDIVTPAAQSWWFGTEEEEVLEAAMAGAGGGGTGWECAPAGDSWAPEEAEEAVCLLQTGVPVGGAQAAGQARCSQWCRVPGPAQIAQMGGAHSRARVRPFLFCLVYKIH